MEMTLRQSRRGIRQISREPRALILQTVLVGCLASLPVSASAAAWAFFAKGPSSVIYLDLSTLRRTGSVRSGWTRETFPGVMEIPGTNKRADTRDTRFALDCATGRTASGEYNFYLRGVWLHHGWGMPDQFTVPADGSIDQLLVAKLCR